MESTSGDLGSENSDGVEREISPLISEVEYYPFHILHPSFRYT